MTDALNNFMILTYGSQFGLFKSRLNKCVLRLSMPVTECWFLWKAWPSEKVIMKGRYSILNLT